MLKTFFKVLAIYFLSSYIYNLYFHPLRGVAGPNAWAVSSIPSAIRIARGSYALDVAALHWKYKSSILRTGPNRLSFIDPIVAEDIYGGRQGKKPFPKDTRSYPKLHKAYNMVNTNNSEDHARMRKVFSHAFSDRALAGYYGTLVSCTDLLIEHLQRQDGKIVDIAKWYNFNAFDIIGKSGKKLTLKS